MIDELQDIDAATNSINSMTEKERQEILNAIRKQKKEKEAALKEIKDTWLDRNKLIELAKLSGTAYLNPDKLQGLPSEIPDMTRNLAFESPPFPLWDNRILFIVLVALLTLEWALRKKYKLL